MQLNPRIVVNLLVILVRILVNLLAKPTKFRYSGGAMGGGPTPSTTSLSQTVAPRNKGLQSSVSRRTVTMTPRGTKARGTPRGTKALGTPVRLMRPTETKEGKKRLPLYDFRSFPTFLGELDSRYQSIY